MQDRMANGTTFYRNIPPSVLSAIFPGEAKWLRPYCAGGKPDKNAIATAMRYLKEADPLYYNSLVDRHTKSYRDRPSVKSHLQKYGYLAEDGIVYPTRREQLEVNRVSRTAREREAMVTQLEIKEKERLERLKRAARAGKVAFTPGGIFETKPCAVCPSVYHKVPSVMDPQTPCPGSCLNASNANSPRLTTDRSSMTTAEPKEDVGVQCRQSEALCGRCVGRSVPAASDPPAAARMMTGAAVQGALFSEGVGPALRKDASSSLPVKDGRSEAFNTQRAKYRAMLEEEEETLRKMIEIERQKLNKAQKEADVAERTSFQRKAAMKEELEAEKERNILERKRKVALKTILNECKIRAKFQLESSKGVNNEIAELKMRFEDAIRHNRVLYLKPPKTTAEKASRNGQTIHSLAVGPLEAEALGVSGELLTPPPPLPSPPSPPRVSWFPAGQHVPNRMFSHSVQNAPPSKQLPTPVCKAPSHHSRGTNTSPPPLSSHHDPADFHLPHVPQTVEMEPLSLHPTKKQVQSEGGQLMTSSRGEEFPPLSLRSHTSKRREGKSPFLSPEMDTVGVRPHLQLPSIIPPPPSRSSHILVPPPSCSLMTSATSGHVGRSAASWPTNAHHGEQGGGGEGTSPTWKSLPTVVLPVVVPGAGEEEPSPLEACQQDQAVQSEVGGDGHTQEQLSKTRKGSPAHNNVIACSEVGLQPAQHKEPAERGVVGGAAPVGASSSLPHRLPYREKKVPRPLRSSLPASFTQKTTGGRVQVQREAESPSPTPSSTDTESANEKHVVFKPEEGCNVLLHGLPGNQGDAMSGSASVPDRLQRKLKGAQPRPLRCSLPVPLARRPKDVPPTCVG